MSLKWFLYAAAALFAGEALAAGPQSAPIVSEPSLRAHLAFLADDLLEGRGTGQRGGELAVRYLETQALRIGLQPLPSPQVHGFLQSVKIIGSQTLPDSYAEFISGNQIMKPVSGSEIVFGSSGGRTESNLDAQVVFVGYGIRAPEERWDDFKGTDLKGKLLIMMVNDPQATADEPQRFGGAALTYYGRWTYKYEEAARQGAAGVLLIHTTPSATYAWNVPQTSFTHERFSLPDVGNAMEGWLQESTARQLFAAAGQNLDQLRAAAERRDFRPVSLNLRLHAKVHSRVRQVEQFNVIGMVPGTDPVLKKQAVVYSAHWDHLGIETDASGKTHIFNGAIDNASGSAALLAMAETAVTHPTRRTQIFLWPCAEEQYLLGSAAYITNPPWPLAATAADLNLDSMNFVARTRDIGVEGSERSNLYQSAQKVAGKMKLKIAPPAPDLGGAFFRADHFNFARAGVPAFNVGSAVFSGDGHFDFDKQPKQVYQQQMKDFKGHYHTEQDRYRPDWDLSGMAQQAQFTLNLGYEVANTTLMPVWHQGEAFANIKR
ncbi:M28 family peptidase [Undibacterium oligocarboniphilum]|uniref:M28 family peptidase n=2 Tax=Undibacterium oligocarboniphilum TaxID=666702 RepID=A0A850QMR0_9BURK|nr:M28 family peptidase [Undibacterium oligocarboniphilum]NVO77366.1 M28 family peptidase [Undibacterium oligocarboniphilum]